jgi:hypothetical protein
MTTSSYLAHCRAEIGDDLTFIQRCLDGTYRGTVLDTADDVIARDHSGVPTEPTPADIAAAIIAAFDEPEPDRPTYGIFHVVRTIRDGQPLHHQPSATRVDATLTDYDSAVDLANALRLTRYRDSTTGQERILSTQQLMACAEDNPPLHQWLRRAARRNVVSDAEVVAAADLNLSIPSRQANTDETGATATSR